MKAVANKTLKLTAARQVGFARRQGYSGGRRQLSSFVRSQVPYSKSCGGPDVRFPSISLWASTIEVARGGRVLVRNHDQTTDKGKNSVGRDRYGHYRLC